MTKIHHLLPLTGYALLAYLVLLLPFHLYEPTPRFDLPNVLWFTHLILLYIHEAGHLLFSIFGRTMGILGGSLNQILAPFVWWIVARREGSRLSNVALVFTGVSLADVSLYVKDSGMLLLPLIGGLSTAHHDWANLLNDWGMIEYGYLIGEIVFWIGMGFGVLGIVTGVMDIRRRWNDPPSAAPAD